MALPNTFIIGVQKAGTTSLHDWLAQHPDVYGPGEFKDVDYFGDPEKSEDVRARFDRDYDACGGESVLLHTQVNYILFSSTLARIKRYVPSARLIVVFRNPVDRAISAYNYYRKLNQESRPIEKALIYEPQGRMEYSKKNCDFAYIEHGLYGRQLENVLNYFDPKQVHVIDFKKLKDNPAQVVGSVFHFLGIDENFHPKFRRKNTTGAPWLDFLHRRLTTKSKAREFLINWLVDWWLPEKKRQKIRKDLIDLNTRKSGGKTDSQRVRSYLIDEFREDQRRFKKILRTNHFSGNGIEDLADQVQTPKDKGQIEEEL